MMEALIDCMRFPADAPAHLANGGAAAVPAAAAAAAASSEAQVTSSPCAPAGGPACLRASCCVRCHRAAWTARAPALQAQQAQVAGGRARPGRGPLRGAARARGRRRAQAAVSERRQELFVLFRAAARVAPAEAHAAVGARLQAALGSPGASAQEVEVAVTLLYQLGEGAPDEALRPGSGALGQMAAGLMAADVPAGGHPLVALALLETFIRYLRCASACPNLSSLTPYALLAPLLPAAQHSAAQHAACPDRQLCRGARFCAPEPRRPSHDARARGRRVLQQQPACLPRVLALFLGDRGMGHPDEGVATRACYLFARLVKALRPELRPLLPDVLAGLQPHLRRIVAQPAPEALTPGGSGLSRLLSAARSPPGVTSATDDRLYAFEAAGLLLGGDDLPAAEQLDAVAALLAPLLAQMDAQLGAAAAAGGGPGGRGAAALVQQALEAVSRASKGFSLALCTRQRPAIGDLLAAPLQAAIRIPQARAPRPGLLKRFRARGVGAWPPAAHADASGDTLSLLHRNARRPARSAHGSRPGVSPRAPSSIRPRATQRAARAERAPRRRCCRATGRCAGASSRSCTAWWSAWASGCCPRCRPRWPRCCRRRPTRGRWATWPRCCSSWPRASAAPCSRCWPRRAGRWPVAASGARRLWDRGCTPVAPRLCSDRALGRAAARAVAGRVSPSVKDGPSHASFQDGA